MWPFFFFKNAIETFFPKFVVKFRELFTIGIFSKYHIANIQNMIYISYFKQNFRRLQDINETGTYVIYTVKNKVNLCITTKK